jgi:hypothetical protein
MALASREFLTLGPVQALTQNVVYGLPARSCWLHSLAALEISVDASTWTALATSTTGVQVGSAFIRCTTGNTSCKLSAI